MRTSWIWVVIFGLAAASLVKAQDAPPGGLQPVPATQWSELHVRRVLQSFANGGQAQDRQILKWANMPPAIAIQEMLNFKPFNYLLSPSGIRHPSVIYCRSLRGMMDFWSSDRVDNPTRVANRPYYDTLDNEQPMASQLHLHLAWTRLMHTPGCNPFLHKTALYLTNYHAAISVQNTQPTLMRSYYDDTVDALSSGADFIALMTQSASHAAVARAYGHDGNYFDRQGQFNGNDDFAREYFQLLFGIQGANEDPLYHENVTIEHNAWLLTGMALDAMPNAWGSEAVFDWLVAPINFTDHLDAAGRPIPNRSRHYASALGQGSCLEILREQVCGATAADKLTALGPIAANHPESLAATPLKFIRFFGDDRIDADEARALQAAWVESDFDVLAFLRAYAISTQFHSPGTVKYRNAFDRNLIIHNANQLSAEQFNAELFFQGPIVRINDQGALVFAPTRDVFGGQTGNDVANDRFVFKSAWDANVTDPGFLGKATEAYQPAPGQPFTMWRRDWSTVIPANTRGQHVVSEVADWLWNHFVADGGARLDVLARAQLHAMLATGFDFGALMNRENSDRIYSFAELENGDAALASAMLGQEIMNLNGTQGNERIGLAVNFITALPWTFAMEVTP